MNASQFLFQTFIHVGNLNLLQVTLPELTGPNYSVMTVTATDKDDDDNAKITYSMLPVTGFTMDPRTGMFLYFNKKFMIKICQFWVSIQSVY